MTLLGFNDTVFSLTRRATEPEDRARAVDRLAPWAGPWTHAVNAAAHVRASIVGGSISVPCEGGELQLGSWQGMFLCEFHGPRTRTVRVTFVPALQHGTR